MNNFTATQFTRVAEQLALTDADAVSLVGRWTEQRERTGRPIGSPAAVLARMTDSDIRTELARYIPHTTNARCPDCNGEGLIYEQPADPAADVISRKCTHPRRAAS